MLQFPVSQIERFSFDDQIQNFNKTTEVIKAKIGTEAATKLLTEALYFIGIGTLYLEFLFMFE